MALPAQVTTAIQPVQIDIALVAAQANKAGSPGKVEVVKDPKQRYANNHKNGEGGGMEKMIDHFIQIKLKL